MIWLTTIFIFLFCFTLIITIIRLINTRRDLIKKRLIAIRKKDWQESNELIIFTANSKTTKNTITSLRRLLYKIKIIKKLDERLLNELSKANLLMKSKEFIVLLILSGLLGSLIGIALANGSIEKGAWVSLISWTIPLIWLNSRKKKRKIKLESQLTDMINMLVNSLKAGYSLFQSLELLSREIPQPLSDEIFRMLQEIRLGETTEQSLINFNQRIESKDMDLIITAILIQRQVGGNLAEVLETIGNTIRERVRIQGEIKSLTAQGRMSMIIFIILPIALGVFLYVSNPEYIMVLFNEPIGWLMVAVAILGQILGTIMIKKIINIEV